MCSSLHPAAPGNDSSRDRRGHGRLFGVVGPTTIERVLPWVLRGIWIALLVVGGGALDRALDGRSDTVTLVARSGVAVLWLAGVASMALLATSSLTAARVIVPLAVPISVVMWSAGADTLEGAGALGLAVAAGAVVCSAETGRAFVQASAYGDEDRFPLRPPPAYLLAALLAWMCWAAALVAGPLLLAAHLWIAGSAITVVAVAGAVWAWPRWHGLTRRWLVLVPAGVVVHDQLVLAETLMIRRNQLAALRLAPAGTEAADLTGPAGGHAVEIVTTIPITAVYASTPRTPQGTAIHLTACLVAPTRPGRALSGALRHRLPVG